MKHQGLACNICKKFYRKNQKYDFDDLMQIANIAILKAIRAFDPQKGALTTLAYYCIAHDLSRFVQANKKNLASKVKKEVEDDHTFFDSMPNLGRTERKIVEMLELGYSRADIMEELGLTVAGYRKIINHIRRRFAENE